jgi:TonB family protein
MTRPQQISGLPAVYSRDAVLAKEVGMVEARCVVTASGVLQKCRLMKSLPHLERQILDSLASRRYSPAMSQGRPVAVDYTVVVPIAPPPAFDASKMTAPVKLSGPDPEYTQQALEHEVEGSMQVRCVVTASGHAHECEVIKGLPFMNAAMVDTLQRWSFQPAKLDGVAIDVDYTFQLNLKLPE